MIEQLKQLTTWTWDGNLISKSYRDQLVKEGYAARFAGYNYITEAGFDALHKLRLLPKKVRP